MKLALIFLSALVVLTHQQFLYQPRAMPWWNYSPQRVLSNYYQQPAYYPNNIDNSPFYRFIQPSRPLAYYQDENEMDMMEDNNEEEYSDVQSRVKSGSRFKPSFLQQKQRFFGLLAGNTGTRPLVNTVKFTLTSTINITSIQSCISAALFANAAAQNVICRRKRERGPNSWDESEDVQFVIDPSETEPLMPTELPTFDNSMREDQEPENYLGVSSSKDEDGSSKPGNPRDKRFFFNYFVTSSTITSYSFATTTVTKAVAIATAAAGGAAGAAPAAGPILCRPLGYVVC